MSGRLADARECYYAKIKNGTATDFDKKMLAQLSKEINDVIQKTIISADSIGAMGNHPAALKKYLAASNLGADNPKLWTKIKSEYIILYGGENGSVKQKIIDELKIKLDSLIFLKYYDASRILLETRMQLGGTVNASELSLFDKKIDSLKFLDKYPAYENDGNFIIERQYTGITKFKFQRFDLKKTLLDDGYMANGVLDGITTQYYPDGKIQAQKTWKMGKLNGEYIRFFQSGYPQGYGFYENGKRQGTFFEFQTNGKVKSVANYLDDTLNGEWIEYFPSGRTSIIVNYGMNKKNGKYIEFYESGLKKAEINYVADKLEGAWTEWYESGTKKLEKFYRNNVGQGRAVFYSEDGKVMRDSD